MFLYDRFRPQPHTQAEMFRQIGCFALKFKYTDTDALSNLPLEVKNDIFEDVMECWEYTHRPDKGNPYIYRTTELDNPQNFEFAWMCLTEWVDEVENDMKTEQVNVIYHMCKRIMLKTKL